MATMRELTVTIDTDLVAGAEEYARSRVLSFSALIEQSLRQAIALHVQSFASRWRGRFNAAERNDKRYSALAQKYLE